MEYANTISGLQRKRDEIAQEIEGLKIQLAKLGNDRLAIERSLQAFGVGEVAEPPRFYEITFERGELRRFILRHLRAHGAATTREITSDIMATKGEDPNDKPRYSRIQQTVSRALAHLADRGGVVRSGSSRGYVWRLVAVNARR
jgi:hypothetical protein